MQKAIDLEAAKAAEQPQGEPHVRAIRSFGLSEPCVREGLTERESDLAILASLHIRCYSSGSACPPVPPHDPVQYSLLPRGCCLACHAGAHAFWLTGF